MKVQNMEPGGSGWQPSRAEVSEFLRGQQLCSFATLDAEGHPQIARVAFSETAAGCFIIGTKETSHKARNVQGDPYVAMEVTDEDARYTVQLEGTARVLSAAEFEAYAEEHYEQLPASRPFKDKPGEINILVTPYHLRFSDCNPYPWVLTEFDH